MKRNGGMVIVARTRLGYWIAQPAS